MKILVDNFSNEISSLKTEIENLKNFREDMNQTIHRISDQTEKQKKAKRFKKTKLLIPYLHFDESHKDKMENLRTKFLENPDRSKDSVKIDKNPFLIFDSNKSRHDFIKEAGKNLPTSFSGKNDNSCNLPRSWINKISNLEGMCGKIKELKNKFTFYSTNKFAKVRSTRNGFKSLIKVLEKYSLDLGKKNK